jgi:hypothetical protein
MKHASVCLLLFLAMLSPGWAAPPTKGPRIDLIELPDSKWSQFGPYVQKFADGIDDRWHTAPVPSDRASIRIEFVLKADGTVGECRVTKGEDFPQRLVDAAKAAVTRGVPYARWSKEMIDQLGTSQKMAFVFACD